MAATLTAYPTDEATGFLIGDGVELAHGHRHFSHLMMLFPLKQLNLTAGSQDRAVAAKSLDHWMGMGDLHGFSYTASSPMNVMLGRKPEAFGNITLLMDQYITANTMYYEGKAYPCGETPPAAASALMDWMLMEWGGVLHVFAGIADANVTDASFTGMLAPGGIEVAARRAGAVTLWVELTNAHGVAPTDMATIALEVEGMPLPWVASTNIRMRVRQLQRYLGPFLAHFPAACHPSRAVYCSLVGGHVCGMLIGACDPMLWPICVFRQTPAVLCTSTSQRCPRARA